MIMMDCMIGYSGKKSDDIRLLTILFKLVSDSTCKVALETINYSVSILRVTFCSCFAEDGTPFLTEPQS